MSPNDRAHITATAQNVQVIAPIYFLCFCRPISPVWAQYGLKRAYVLTALRAYGASYAIAPCGGNTLRGYGYVLGLSPCAHTPPL